MLRRSNKRKNKSDKSIERTPAANTPDVNDVPPQEPVYEDTMSREDFIMHNEDARKVYEDIRKLRESVKALKVPEPEIAVEEKPAARKKTYREETAEIIAAKQAILEQAKKDALEKRAKVEETIRKEQEAMAQQQRALEAQRRAALIEEEAERKRRQAEEAERRAKETSRKAALEAMEAERKAREEQEAKLADEAARKEGRATAAEMKAFFGEETPAEPNEANLERAKKELLNAQKLQEANLNLISRAAEHHTTKLAEVQQEKLEKQQDIIKSKQEEVVEILDEHKEQRIERLTKDVKDKKLRKLKALEEKRLKEERQQALKAEKLARLQAEKEAKAAKMLAEKKAKAAKLLTEKEAKAAKMLAEREEKRIKEEKRRLERQRKAEERELIKRARKDAEARAQLERLRLEAKSRADAELGGGIVNVQGMTINTEILEVPNVKWRDLFNIRTKKERQAETDSERRKLARERRKRSDEARQIVDFSIKRKMAAYEKTAFAKKFNAFKAFCERKKVALITTFAIVLVVLVATAGVFNYYTAYAYSYNGKTLGIVKEKDDVLRITDLVQGALTEDKNVDVVIDARKDIQFERVATVGDVKIDTSEDVLKRLTYMGDLNVKAYCIFIDGKKVGAVESKAVAEEVFRDIEKKYTSGMEDSEIQSIEIVEQWEAKEDNISLENVMTQEEMVSLLCTSGQKETLHEVVAGETLSDVAKLYSMTEEEILEDNPNVDKRKLTVGSKIIIKKEAPILTVKIVEKVSYEKVIEHKVEKKDSKDIYEGYTETKQKGKDGLSQVTSRITLVNGEKIDEEVLESEIKKEAVTEIILVGTKERPPSVGSGKYIWPLESGYTLTSGFKYRWGRLHEGIDLGTSTGNNVLAADGGVVTYAGYSGAYGYLIKIDHQNGMETRYAHNSQLLVSTGDKVFQGMHIAESGNSGRSTGPHLHFEIRVDGVAKDPLSYLP